MKLHTRELMVNKIIAHLDNEINIQTEELTNGEYIKVLSTVFCNKIATVSKYMIRKERHGNISAPGGIE